MSDLELEAVSQAKGNAIAEATGGTEKIPLRAEVDRHLQGEGKFVFKTNLGVEANTEVVFISASEETHIGTKTGIPAEATSDVEVPLIDASEVDVGTPFLVVVPAKVEFEAVGRTKAMLIGEFGGSAVAEGTTDTESILCVASKTEGYNGKQKNKYFLHKIVVF